MLDKCSSYSKTAVFENLDFGTPSEMTTGCYEASFLLFANAREVGTPLTMPSPPRLILYQTPGIYPRGF